jgi:hypothetical protein
MKASDSTNSLTELTGRDECFICLSIENDKEEPLVDSKLLRTCGCKFFVHPACWNEWLKDKTDYDCPICRKQSLFRINVPPNPVFLVEMPQEPRRRFQLSYSKMLLIFVFTGFAAGLIFSLVFRE